MLIRSDDLEVLVLPEIGGKIAQVRDRRSGYEWLIPPQRPYRTLMPGTRWIEYDTSGMDDCFPNVDECLYPSGRWLGTALPQLGEWVYGTWEILDGHSTDRVSLNRTGWLLPCRAYKEIHIEGSRIEVRYRVENPTDAPMPYLWSAHPLITAAADFRLLLPVADDATFVTYPPDGNVYRWPHYGAVDLSREWIEPGRTLKIFVSGLRAGSCSLQTDGGMVHFGFDIESVPVLGIWFNNFGFPRDGRSPFRCIAVEPCTAASDVLDQNTVRSGSALAPGAQREWGIRMEFRRGSTLL